MKNEQCPLQHDLSAFVRCEVSEEQADAISEHVANCPDCEETVVRLEKGTDTVLDRLKGMPAPFPFQDEPERARMAQAAKQHPPGNPSGRSADQPPVAMLEQLRDYRILEKIGEGGMGAVYRAIHTRLNKTVALKVLSSSRLKDVSAIGRFQREISIVGRLQHPNIVQAHDAGEHDGQHYLVMEFVEGSDLSEIVRRRGPLPVNAACEIIAQAAVGLQYAHENGLVHRDIKPSNLMLSVSGDQRTNEVSAAVVKILDLGLARLHTDDKEIGRELTTDGQMVGTLDYMAPEQGGDSHAVDIRADIYSLGATLYKLLTGEAPFGGERHRSVMQKLTDLAMKPAPSVRERRPEVSESLAAIISRMLSKQPQDRFATPAEVAIALQPFRSSAELPALLGLSSRPAEVKVPDPTVPLASNNQPPKICRPFAATAMWFSGAAALFAIILTITTKHGMIEVESPDGKLPDDVKVVVSRGGDGVEVLQADNQWRASVAGGKFQLTLQGGGDQFELQESTLAVSRFGKSVVTLRVKQAAAAPVVAKQQEVTATNPDRFAAEYVLSIGGVVTIKEKYEERDITTVGDLPRKPFEFTRVHLAWNETATDSGLASFQGCKNLTHVDFGAARNVGDVGLAYLRDCKKITSLALQATMITDEGLANFKHCKQLEALELDGCKVGDEGLAHIQDCPNLLQLGLGYTFVSDAGLANFKQCQKLTYLGLRYTQVTDAGLTHFKDCKNLEQVNLESTKVSDAGLAHFKDCKNLKSVALASTKVSDAGLGHFNQCQKLTKLSLQNTQVSDAGLAHFKDCKNLTSIDLAATPISDAGLAALLKDRTNLTELNLSTTQVSDVTLELLAAFPNLGYLHIEQTKVTEPGVKKLAAALPECKIILDGGVIEPSGSVSPQPPASEPLPDRAMPFVRVSPQGEVRGEYRFANEALAILEGDDILEVHGNGPFKVGQIIRRDSSLHIRAGKGYRPRFVVGFEIPATAREFQSGPMEWFKLENVTLSIEGCDFIGGLAAAFHQFAGTGGNWSFEDCRLIQPATFGSVILVFQGESVIVRNSLLSLVTTGNGNITNLAGVDRIRFEGNVLQGATAMVVDAGIPQQITLKDNIFYRSLPILVYKTMKSGDHPVVEAQDNVIIQSALLWSVGATPPMPHPNFTWKGRGNRCLPVQRGFLWERPVAEGEAASGLATVAEWNEYWKNPDDLTQIDSDKFAWDVFEQADWTASRERIGTEITAARQRFPDLAKLGPDTARVGSGAAYDEALRANDPAPVELRVAAMEGGPFVLIRDGQAVEGYVSLPNALPHAKDGDVIEVRSDGSFPAFLHYNPFTIRLTVRAGAGYRPSFAQFVVNNSAGDWTLEGLHLRGKAGEPALLCRARRIANCSVEMVAQNGHVHISAPENAEQSTEIVNCYFPNPFYLLASKARIENSILANIRTDFPEKSSLEVLRSSIWSHFNLQQPDLGTAFANSANTRIRCVDCLIDADALDNVVGEPWHGERNLYRFSRVQWPFIVLAKDKYKEIWSLTDWQEHWNSDLDSREDDSILLRKELWLPK